MDLPILYEDNDLVAVAKPSGMVTHPHPGSSFGETAQEWFLRHYPAGAGYAHRLDRDTSGVLVFAKNSAALEFLHAAFSSRKVKKTYLALVYGALKEKTGVIDFPIGRSRANPRLRSAQPRSRGRQREAVTRYEAQGEHDGITLLVVRPETGRTHQIRAHLKAIHHPVVCDPLYASGRPCALRTGRLALHAYALELPLPSGGRREIIAPLPADLAETLEPFPEARAFARA